VTLYLWFDCETTGLDPARHAIIEVAAILTGPDLQPVREITTLVDPDPDDCWDPEVVAIHDQSGLRAGLYAQAGQPGGLPRIDDVTYRVSGMIAAYGRGSVNGSSPSNVILAGRSVHFDRSFIRARMPALDRRLSHRHLDVSAIERFCVDAWGDRCLQAGPKPHRARADLDACLQHYRMLRDIAASATPSHWAGDGEAP
jgi:oligoribonuclease